MEQYTYLCHHGVKNQKWGYRRYQNQDGSYTELGREHYGIGKARDKKHSEQIDAYAKKIKKFATNSVNSNVQNAFNTAGKAAMLTVSTSIGQAASKYLPSLSASVVSAGKNAVSAMLASGIDPVAAGIIGTAAVTAAYITKRSLNKESAASEPSTSSGRYTTGSKETSVKDALSKIPELDVGELSDGTLWVSDRRKPRSKLGVRASLLNPGTISTVQYIGAVDKRSGKQAAISLRNKQGAAKALRTMGYTMDEIAEKLDMSPSTVNKLLS